MVFPLLLNDAQISSLVSKGRPAIRPPGECQQILRNHGYALDFWTTSFTDCAPGLSLDPYAATINIFVSLKSTGAFNPSMRTLVLCNRRALASLLYLECAILETSKNF